MFTIRLQFPDKLKQPLEEVAEKYSKKNNVKMLPEDILETLVKRYIADEYRLLLLESEDEEGSNGRSN